MRFSLARARLVVPTARTRSQSFPMGRRRQLEPEPWLGSSEHYWRPAGQRQSDSRSPRRRCQRPKPQPADSGPPGESRATRTAAHWHRLRLSGSAPDWPLSLTGSAESGSERPPRLPGAFARTPGESELEAAAAAIDHDRRHSLPGQCPGRPGRRACSPGPCTASHWQAQAGNRPPCRGPRAGPAVDRNRTPSLRLRRGAVQAARASLSGSGPPAARVVPPSRWLADRLLELVTSHESPGRAQRLVA
jgi:hypothetical protein